MKDGWRYVKSSGGGKSQCGGWTRDCLRLKLRVKVLRQLLRPLKDKISLKIQESSCWFSEVKGSEVAAR